MSADSAKKKDAAADTIARGSLFAKQAGYKYGTPKHLLMRASPAEQAHDFIGPLPSALASKVPGKSGETTASTPAVAGPASLSNAFSSTASTGTASAKVEPPKENLEHAVYFQSWGKPVQRDSPVAEKRRVLIHGDPGWETSPKPDFVASLVYGGALEQIHCQDHSAAVTFLNAADAKKYFDSTPNGIVFRKTSDEVHYAEVRMAEDVTPLSSLVRQYVEAGYTRCVRAVGVDPTMSLEYLRGLALGKQTARGTFPRKLEKLLDGVNAVGYRDVTFRFCDIRDAVTFKSSLARDEEWEEVNIHYTADPCADAAGPRVDIRPVAKVG